MQNTRTIKILYTINDLGIGGAQRILADLVCGLPQNEFCTVIANLSVIPDCEIADQLLHRHIRIVTCQYTSKMDIRRMWWLCHIIKTEKPDILHSHLWFASLLSAILGKIAGCQIILSTEHNTTTFATRPLWYIFLSRLFLSLNCVHIVVSKAVRDAILKKSPALAKKSHLIYNGIDTAIFHPAPEMGGNFLRDAQCVVGTLVRNDPRKGFAVFQHAASLAARPQKSLKFVAAFWRDKKEAENIDFQRVDGSRESVAAFMRQLSIFVLPSFEEGLGLVLLEAMASRVAVVASRVGGILEIVQDGENGLLFQPGDSVDLLAKIKDVAFHPDLAQLLTKRARENVEKNFTLSHMVERHRILYHKLATGEHGKD